MTPLLHFSLQHFLIIARVPIDSPAGNNDSGQFEFMITTAMGAVGILVTGFVPILLFIIQNKRGLAYEVTDEKVFITPSSTNSNLTPSAIEGHKVTLRLWNAGGQAILPEENYGAIEFVFGTGTGIQKAKISQKYPATLGVINPTIEGAGSKIVLAKPSTPLNKSYWVEFELLMMRFQGDIQVNSNIRNCEIRNIPYSLMRSRKRYFYCTYIIFGLFFLTTLLFSVITHHILNQFVDLVIVGGIWLWWLARRFDVSPRKLRQILQASLLVLALLIAYIAMHFVTIYLLMPNVIKIWG